MAKQKRHNDINTKIKDKQYFSFEIVRFPVSISFTTQKSCHNNRNLCIVWIDIIWTKTSTYGRYHLTKTLMVLHKKNTQQWIPYPTHSQDVFESFTRLRYKQVRLSDVTNDISILSDNYCICPIIFLKRIDHILLFLYQHSLLSIWLKPDLVSLLFSDISCGFIRDI